ncbi:MAG: Ig domain-containing protein, partial [Candidatus Korobacteraceae bacterium]
HGQPLGYLTLWPDAESKPVVATLNALDGAITSNMAIVPTLNGSIDAFATTPTDLVADIFSYFAPISPLNITTTSLPSATLNFQYSATLGASGGVPPYTWSVTVGNLPPGLNLDSASGLISGTPTIADTYPFTVQVADAQTPPATASAPLSITVNPTLTQLTVLTTSLPPGTQNTVYNVMLAATGGLTPYTWSITAGSLPVGLHLDANSGAITGTPSGAGISTFTVQVTDLQLSTASKQLSITIAPAVALSITTTSLPSGTAGTAYSATLTAVGGVYPYTWSLTSGSLPFGLFLNANTGAITGTPTTAGTSNFTVQVADSATPPATASAPLSIVINPGGGGNPGALTGNYAFFLNGFNSSGAWTLAGSFISDGNGHITSGVVDRNSVGGQPFNTTVSGTYWIAANGLNTLTIQGQSFGPVTFAFDLSASGSGRIIEYDDTTGSGSRGAGVLRKADPSAFSLNALNGGWVMGMTGVNSTGQSRQVVTGQMSVANGSISNGTGDINEGGAYSTITFSGNVSSIDAQTGRGVATIQSTFGTSHQAVYVVSASELVMEQIDAENPLQVGSVLKQTGPFNNGSLNGLSVLYYQDIHAAEGADQSGAMIINFNGNGNANGIAADEDLAGVITQKTPFQGTYTVAANGALSLGTGNPAGFLISQNHGFFVGTGSNSIFGTIEPQSGAPFSNASIAGTYAAGTLPPLDYANGSNEVDVGPANGLGTLTLNGDYSQSGGIGQSLGTIVSYSIASNGRGTAEAQGDQAPSVVYVISPAKFVILRSETDARVLVSTH